MFFVTFATTLSFAAELTLGPYDRVRVDVPDYPGALTTSDFGSVLAAPPPAGTPYRIESTPEIDSYVATEAIDAMAVTPWHSADLTGAGVKIAVFDVQWFNAEAASEELGQFTTHDCETQRSCDAEMDTLHPRYSWEEGSHGVACAEVIRDIAPEAELSLVRVNGATTFENAAAWAVRNEIDIVSMSMSFFNNSFYDGTGPLNDIADTMAAGGVLLVNSAGNYHGEHWIGDLDDTDRDGDLDFPWGSSYLPVDLNAGSTTLYVSWDEFGDCGDSDFDVVVYDDDGDIVGQSSSVQDPEGDSCSPLERVSVHAEESDWYYLRIFRNRGDYARVSVFARGGQVYSPQPGSLADPATALTAFTVGAVRANESYAQNGAESFSSRGPSHSGANKPNIAGPDGLSSRIYGPRGFYGTSAATPAVAAAIALRMSGEPDISARDAADALAASAMGTGATWEQWDGELGSGRARLVSPEFVGQACGGGGAAIVVPLLWWSRLRRRALCRG